MLVLQGAYSHGSEARGVPACSTEPLSELHTWDEDVAAFFCLVLLVLSVEWGNGLWRLLLGIV